MKDVSKLTAADFEAHKVWRFTGSDSPSEMMVRPSKLPLRSFTGALVGCVFRLSSGRSVRGYLSNLSPENPELMKHFLAFSAFHEDGRVFHLSRYHDFDYSEYGPDALAKFLGFSRSEIFPISWDARGITKIGDEHLKGEITEEPAERLTRAQVIQLAVR